MHRQGADQPSRPDGCSVTTRVPTRWHRCCCSTRIVATTPLRMRRSDGLARRLLDAQGDACWLCGGRFVTVADHGPDRSWLPARPSRAAVGRRSTDLPESSHASLQRRAQGPRGDGRAAVGDPAERPEAAALRLAAGNAFCHTCASMRTTLPTGIVNLPQFFLSKSEEGEAAQRPSTP